MSPPWVRNQQLHAQLCRSSCCALQTSKTFCHLTETQGSHFVTTGATAWGSPNWKRPQALGSQLRSVTGCLSSVGQNEFPSGSQVRGVSSGDQTATCMSLSCSKSPPFVGTWPVFQMKVSFRSRRGSPVYEPTFVSPLWDGSP